MKKNKTALASVALLMLLGSVAAIIFLKKGKKTAPLAESTGATSESGNTVSLSRPLGDTTGDILADTTTDSEDPNKRVVVDEPVRTIQQRTPTTTTTGDILGDSSNIITEPSRTTAIVPEDRLRTTSVESTAQNTIELAKTTLSRWFGGTSEVEELPDSFVKLKK
jgi:hypothetical protein